MANHKEPTKINSYKRKWNFNIGLVLFGVILIYLAVTVLTYLTAKHVAVYEVREGSILKDTAYSGFIVRSEITVPSDGDGYLNFYPADKSKISVGMKTYALSEEKISEPAADDAESTSALSADEKDLILGQTQAFIAQFNNSRFSDTYTFKNDVEAVLAAGETESRTAQLNALAQNAETAGMSVYSSLEDGLLLYGTDGYEDIKLKDVDKEELEPTDYEMKQSRNNQKVKVGDPIYKLITDETWTVVIGLTEQTAKELAEAEQVKVRFAKDNQEMVGAITVEDKGAEGNFGYLIFEKAMVRYAGDRYLDIELIMEDQSGLKIPKSAEVKKDFYVIPQEYLTQGGNSNSTGVMFLDQNGETDLAPVFTAVTVYYLDEETGLAYLGMESLKKGSKLMKPDSDETIQLGETQSLNGVYNVNKGYATFRQISILSESEDYYIVQSGNRYGLSNYDHIALDGDNINEHDVVF